ncbi:protein kinase [Planctomycetota bacterium]
MPTTHDNEEIIFHKALKIDSPSERTAFLESTCVGHPELLARVKILLQASGPQGDLFDVALLDPGLTLDSSRLPEGPGTVVGRYKLLEKIGEGGMAVVYMAEQERPVRRKVAFKIIKLGMDTKQVIARFEAERQALAVMEHANIAQVFDGGSTDTGRPYFVMELVHGVSITDYCDINKLAIPQRLDLFIQVCHAVQHAHQKGIIHRDLKPSNVMVTLHDDRAIPKVIDFGIAKATHQRLTEKTLFTRYAQLIGTPEYMSPEQAQMSGLDVDIRTDIYSLGVLLYELLTGTTPFGPDTLKQAGYSEIERIIRETDPPKPSTRLRSGGSDAIDVSKRQQSNRKVLAKLIKGDLDWIVMKCLEKDRTRRYETAHAFAEDIERHIKSEPILARSPSLLYRTQKFLHRHHSRIAASAAIIVLLIGLVTIATKYWRTSRLEWAKGDALPRLVELVKAGDYHSAFPLAQRVRKVIPNDSTFVDLWARMSRDFSITTVPAGASISYRQYAATDTSWQSLGESPLENLTLARGLYRWKIEKSGFVTHECVSEHSVHVRLRAADLAGDMVWMDGWTTELHKETYAQSTTVAVPAYWIDRYEVTNEQFKAFVDAGAYRNSEYWQGLAFIKDGRKLTCEEALSHFRDSTGQPGPSTWRDGTYASGQARYPVGGISWYEAKAYARFAGKSLPTAHHWQRAACPAESFVIIPFSNFSLVGPSPVGTHGGMGHTGLYDMAGNVKEWCHNGTHVVEDLRYILGGAWGEPTYMFAAEDFRSPWDRSALNGFRCAQYPEGKASLPPKVFAPFTLYPSRDVSDLESFSDDEFRSLKAQYQYDRTPLHATVESTEDDSPFWRREQITLDPAYEGKRLIAYLFLPKTGRPPYQTVVYFPGVGAVWNPNFGGLPQRDVTEYIITNGRALLYPVYYGTYDRPASRGRVWTPADIIETPLAYRDWTIKMVKDLSRCLDYLKTRHDIRSDKLAFYGMSWGATLGPIALAVEERFQTGVLVVGGIPPVDLSRSIDVALYAERVKAPVLMVNGREDFFLPKETSQIPLYRRLGSPEEHKQYIPYPGGHGMYGLFYKQIQEDVLMWLDRYLGPVEARQPRGRN